MKEKELYHTVLQEMLITGEHAKPEIDANTAAKPVAEKGRFRISRRAIIAIAVAATMVVVSTAVAATSIFARRNYTPEKYLRQDFESREANGESIPDIEHALKAAMPQDVSYKIRMMPEIDHDGKLAQERETTGQPPYSEADWAWVRDLKPTIGDVLYDGKALYVTTYVETDRPELFANDADTKQQVWIACEEATYRVEGDDYEHRIELYGENWGNGYTDHSVTIVAESDLLKSFPEEGLVTMTERLYVSDALCNDMIPERAAIAVIDFTFTFDAAAGKPVAEEKHVSIALSGEHVLTMESWNEGDRGDANNHPNLTMKNAVLSLDGVVLDGAVEYRPTGIYVTFSIKEAPSSWTDYEKNSLLFAIDSLRSLDVPGVVCRINGDEVVPLEAIVDYASSDKVCVLLPVYPSDYASVSSLALDVYLYRIVAANGSEPTDDWSFTFDDNSSLHIDQTASDLLGSIEIPIPAIH